MERARVLLARGLALRSVVPWPCVRLSPGFFSRHATRWLQCCVWTLDRQRTWVQDSHRARPTALRRLPHTPPHPRPRPRQGVLACPWRVVRRQWPPRPRQRQSCVRRQARQQPRRSCVRRQGLPPPRPAGLWGGCVPHSSRRRVTARRNTGLPHSLQTFPSIKMIRRRAGKHSLRRLRPGCPTTRRQTLPCGPHVGVSRRLRALTRCCVVRY